MLPHSTTPVFLNFHLLMLGFGSVEVLTAFLVGTNGVFSQSNHLYASWVSHGVGKIQIPHKLSKLRPHFFFRIRKQGGKTGNGTNQNVRPVA